MRGWGLGSRGKGFPMGIPGFLRAWLLSASRDQTGLSWLFEVTCGPRVGARAPVASRSTRTGPYLTPGPRHCPSLPNPASLGTCLSERGPLHLSLAWLQAGPYILV